SNTSRLGKIKHSKVKIMTVNNFNSTFSAGTEYTNSVYYIKKQMKYNDNTYYLISENPSSTTGVIGWVNSKDITTYTHKHVDSNTKTLYLKGSGAAYNRPWGGSENIVYTSSSLSKYK